MFNLGIWLAGSTAASQVKSHVRNSLLDIMDFNIDFT